MRVLITGGAGFVGSNLADRLIGNGDIVTVVDNFETARRDNLTPNRNLTLIEGSIADPKVVDRAFDEHRPEVVVHAAASYKDPDNWYGDAMTNVVGCEPDELAIGMALEVAFEAINEELTIPVFRPAVST